LSRSILITNYHLQNLEGSEIHCLELAEYFLEQGYKVEVAAFRTGQPMISRFRRIGINLMNFKNFNPENCYDLVWSHHRPVFYYLHLYLKIKSKYFIHQMLSPFVELEYFPLFSDSKLDNRLVFFANSHETKLIAQRQSGNADINVLHNSIPDAYFKFRSTDLAKIQIKHIGVISSHPPVELRTAMEIFEKNGICVTFYGKKDKVIEITPELLNKFDLIVTIGKTVQYCFACAIPVYNYDYHGGGYISFSKLNELEFYNFSGRYPGLLKSPECIYNEIKSGFQDAIKDLPSLQKEASKRYRLDIQLNNFFNDFNYETEAKSLSISGSELQIKNNIKQVSPKKNKIRKALTKIRNYLKRNDK